LFFVELEGLGDKKIQQSKMSCTLERETNLTRRRRWWFSIFLDWWQGM